jgi:hypothetical protein
MDTLNFFKPSMPHVYANTILHEMGHLCGIANYGIENQPTAGQQYGYADGAWYIGDKCVHERTGEVSSSWTMNFEP